MKTNKLKLIIVLSVVGIVTATIVWDVFRSEETVVPLRIGIIETAEKLETIAIDTKLANSTKKENGNNTIIMAPSIIDYQICIYDEMPTMSINSRAKRMEIMNFESSSFGCLNFDANNTNAYGGEGGGTQLGYSARSSSSGQSNGESNAMLSVPFSVGGGVQLANYTDADKIVLVDPGTDPQRAPLPVGDGKIVFFMLIIIYCTFKYKSR